MHPRTRNVTRIFRQATPDQLAAGRDWYARARRLAEELAYRLPESHRHHGDVERAAAVIAVLSPRVSWPLNVRLARQAYSLAAVNSQASQYAPNLRGIVGRPRASSLRPSPPGRSSADPRSPPSGSPSRTRGAPRPW
jgi:hypothetical protein